MKLTFSRLAVGLICVAAGSGAMAFTQAKDTAFLESIQRGMWQLRALNGGSSNIPASQICLGSPDYLVQMQHGSAGCEQYLVRSTPNSVTISYSCKGKGQGLTTVRKESARLLQIQSQGIRNNAPFSFVAEARFAGSC